MHTLEWTVKNGLNPPGGRREKRGGKKGTKERSKEERSKWERSKSVRLFVQVEDGCFRRRLEHWDQYAAAEVGGLMVRYEADAPES
jgi:hypothetical protein